MRGYHLLDKLGPSLELARPPLSVATAKPPFDLDNDDSEGHTPHSFLPRGVKVIKLTEVCLMSSAYAHGFVNGNDSAELLLLEMRAGECVGLPSLKDSSCWITKESRDRSLMTDVTVSTRPTHWQTGWVDCGLSICESGTQIHETSVQLKVRRGLPRCCHKSQDSRIPGTPATKPPCPASPCPCSYCSRRWFVRFWSNCTLYSDIWKPHHGENWTRP